MAALAFAFFACALISFGVGYLHAHLDEYPSIWGMLIVVSILVFGLMMVFAQVIIPQLRLLGVTG